MRITNTIAIIVGLALAFAGGMALQNLRDGETFIQLEKQLDGWRDYAIAVQPKQTDKELEELWTTNSGKAVAK
jgi:hypothetical protein